MATQLTTDSIRRRPVWRAVSLALLALGMAAPAAAEKVSFQFSQVFPGGGQVDGFVIGEDLDGDGKLYSIAPLIRGFLGLPEGDEVEYVSIHVQNINGRSFTQVYSKEDGGLEDDNNAFFGFSYNLDGGAFGDDDDEGMFLGPLAPSTSYIMGPRFAPAQAAQSEAGFGPCGNPDGLPCAAITTLLPVDPFPNFELTFNLFSSAAVPTTTDLRFTFRQTGFDGGGVVQGWIAGKDLDGDGRLYSMGPFTGGFFNLPTGDEVRYAHVNTEGFNGDTLRQTVDLVGTPRDDNSVAFFWAGYNLTNRYFGGDPDEGFSLGPLAPSTSFSAGRLVPFNSGVAFEDEPFGLCGEEGALCSAVYSLTPSEPFPAVETTFFDLSGNTIEMVPAPLVADRQFSGLWYDTAREGEGFSLTPLDSGDAAVTWYTYDEEGVQRWFNGVGRREGLSIIVDELAVTRGGLFGPEFDPETVEREVVGSLRIDFAHCNAGTATYTVNGVDGSQNLVRLTRTDRLRCHGPQG
ncbi:hypothetical protein [Pseudomarimonas salicorniae]|uniref:YD repeat-containing protein n=1 Tax=Pseudomarimonas salicorniae TaxID=2933270 RepID=A0ABT0GI42_9GAMM|nr:hypothetical protein [Lysobacter sp. CAU 1642]MCK7594217.1 hypothetical protein [Lysobacter sp. CAU 1642]